MAASETVVACTSCGLVQRLPPMGERLAYACARCGAFLTQHKTASGLHVTAALSLAALILYVPANIFPILSMSMYGTFTESTVWDGVVKLAESNQWFVAVIVFLASIVIPLFKLAALFFLVITVKLRWRRWQRMRAQMYAFIDVVGPWAMLDVFLLAILVALVQLGHLATIWPGPGLLAFTCVVVLTVLASQTFDPHLIWNPPPQPRPSSR
jgi:paraquat-inducible protein A